MSSLLGFRFRPIVKNKYLHTAYILLPAATIVAKVIFLHLFVILFLGMAASVHAGIPPPGPDPTLEHPIWYTLLWHTPPSGTPPPPSSLRHTHPTGMYSCLFLFILFFQKCLEDISLFCGDTDTPVSDFW